MDMLASGLVMWVFPGLMLLAAASDFVGRRIPNLIPALVLGGFVVLALVTAMPVKDFAFALLAGFAALVVGFGLFAINQMGGGDAKLIAAALPWFGATIPGIEFVVYTTLWGAGLSLLFLLRRLAPIQLMLASNRFSVRLLGSTGKREVPYGIAIAIAAIQMHASLKALHLGL